MQSALLMMMTTGTLCGVAVPTAAAQQQPSTAPPAETTPAPDAARLEQALRTCGALLQRGRYRDVQNMLEPLVAEHPSSGRAHLYLAIAFHKEKKYQHALPLFERAIALDPEFKPALMFHGWCLYYLGRIDEAHQRFSTFLETRPDYGDAQFALGLIAFDRDDIAQARQRFDTAIAVSSKVGDKTTESKARARLGDVFMREGQLAEARTEFEKSVALNPDNYTVYFKLSRACVRLGDHDAAKEARRLFEEVRNRVRPPNPRHRMEDR